MQLSISIALSTAFTVYLVSQVVLTAYDKSTRKNKCNYIPYFLGFGMTFTTIIINTVYILMSGHDQIITLQFYSICESIIIFFWISLNHFYFFRSLLILNLVRYQAHTHVSEQEIKLNGHFRKERCIVAVYILMLCLELAFITASVAP